MKTKKAVRVAVVGHANTGKTSLIRTLLRDTEFGDVADYAGTTRHVEAAQLRVDGKVLLEIFDTPGLEDSVALKQLWNRKRTDDDLSNQQRMSDFIGILDQHPAFAQEQKVLRQAYKSDVLLYVIDAREPYLGKYRDEISLLNETGRPIVPVLNFIGEAAVKRKNWRDKLIDHGMHAVVEYDTVAFTMEAERRLYEKLKSMAEDHYDAFQAVIEHNADDYQSRCEAAAKAIAEQYIDIAAYRIVVNQDSIELGSNKIQALVRKAEQKTVHQLLSIFGFTSDDIRNEFLPVRNGQWELDLFDAQTYKDFGLQAGGGAAKGAALGVGIDLFVGGVSMGVGAAIGAVAGAIWQSLKKYGGSIKNKFTGHSYLCVDEKTVQLFYLRQTFLLSSLMARGHASQKAVTLDNHVTHATQNSELPEEFHTITRRIRHHNHWSNLDNVLTRYLADSDPARIECRETLIEELLKQP